jgi:death-on-curing protein
VIYLTVPELIYIAGRVLDGDVTVRDYGLLESATARPRATVFGIDAYENVEEKAAALLHSLVRNHALIDGNKRLALAAAVAFLGVNGRRLTLSNDQAYELVIEVATGELEEVASIADRIRRGSEARTDKDQIVPQS